MKYLLFAFFGYLAISDASVLPPTRELQNDANKTTIAVVDAILNNGETPKIDEAKLSRKQDGDRSDQDSDSSSGETESKQQQRDSNSLAIGIDTGKETGKSDGIDMLLHTVKSFVKDNGPYFRSKKFEINDVETNQPKNSVGLELNTKNVLDTVNTFLSSRRLKKTADKLARKAAIIFRALKDEEQ